MKIYNEIRFSYKIMRERIMLKGEVIRFEANQDETKRLQKSYKLYLNMRYEEKIMNEIQKK